jgi:hypothetical protein
MLLNGNYSPFLAMPPKDMNINIFSHIHYSNHGGSQYEQVVVEQIF